MQDLISAVDGDDVILKTRVTKRRYMDEHFPNKDLIRDVRSYDRTTLVPIVGLEFYEQMNAFIKSREPTLTTPPLDGALEGVQELSELVQVHVLSARTPEEIKVVREWFEKYGFLPYIADLSSSVDSKYEEVPQVTGKKKVDVALHKGAVLFVDDDERHMPQEPVGGLLCLLFGEGERKNIAPHITIAKDWSEVVAYARQLVPLQYN